MRHAPLILLFLILLSAPWNQGQTTPLPRLTLGDSIPYRVISKGGDAGSYQAFADGCRLKNGDIAVVFYAGYAHVSAPNEMYPKGGRICLVRSSDEGRTWSTPVTIYDDADDNRDPHISQLRDGTVLVSFFTLHFPIQGSTTWKGKGPQLIRSVDNGLNWTRTAQAIPVPEGWFCSAPVRELPEGTLLLPLYYQEGRGVDQKAWGGVVRSTDGGKTWGSIVPIGEQANLPLAAETDFVELKNGSLLAALRGQRDVPMHYAISTDRGLKWSTVTSFGFLGHSPAFTRLKSGPILLTYRGFAGTDRNSAYTALRVSFDEGRHWQGPYLVDYMTGAYPSTIELKDHTILCVYYEEGPASAIRILRFKHPSNEQGKSFSEPAQLVAVPYSHH